eukprot:6390772-Prymnesium_polylepis.1
MASEERRMHIENEVLRAAHELVGSTAVALTPETPLMEAGVDSLAATELTSRLRAATGVALSPTLMFEHPTARAVAVHMLEQMGIAESKAADGPAAREYQGAHGSCSNAVYPRCVHWVLTQVGDVRTYGLLSTLSEGQPYKLAPFAPRPPVVRKCGLIAWCKAAARTTPFNAAAQQMQSTPAASAAPKAVKPYDIAQAD